jgi:signal peptidase I
MVLSPRTGNDGFVPQNGYAGLHGNPANAPPPRRWSLYLTWLFALLALIAPTLAHTLFGLGVAPVLGGSMRPLVAPGDLLLTKTTRADALHVGNIVSLRNPITGVLYAHRIVSITPVNGVLQLVTKGDGNPSLDQDPVLLSRNAAVQRTVGYAKWLGTPLAFLTSQSGRTLGITLLVGSNALTLMLFAYRRGRRNETEAAVPPNLSCKLAPVCALRSAAYSDLAFDSDLLMQDIRRYLTKEDFKRYLTKER